MKKEPHTSISGIKHIYWEKKGRDWVARPPKNTGGKCKRFKSIYDAEDYINFHIGKAPQ